MGSDQIQMRRGKFKEYYILNSGLVSPMSYVLSLVLAVGAALLPGDKNNFGVTIITLWACCVKDIIKVCSKTLYQKEAYFYQSFPVTPFQTVLAKTLVCAQLLQTAPLAFSATKLVTTGELYGLEKGGIAAVILGMVGLEAFCLGLGSIFLIGLYLANGFRDRKKGRPGTTASIIFIGIMLAGDVLVLSRETLNALDNMTVVALSSVVLVLEAILFLWINKDVLRKYYSL